MIFELGYDSMRPLPGVLIAVGLGLLGVYAYWLFRAYRKGQATDEVRLKFIGGWSGGCVFLTMAALLALPTEYMWLYAAGGVALIFTFFPVSFALRKAASAEARTFEPPQAPPEEQTKPGED